MNAGCRLSLVLLLAGLAGGCADPAATEDRRPAPPAVHAAECRWAGGAIKIDGKLDEPAWRQAPVLKDFAVYWQRRSAKTATRARLLWDDQNLYFAAEMEDSDLYADVKEHNGMLWSNDVFELFFKPAADRPSYYEFQVNAANAQLEMFLPSRGAGGYQRFAKRGPLGMASAVQLQGTLNHWQDRDTGWTVEGRIPWTVFKDTGGKPRAGDRWRFALCRYDYSATLEQPELSSTAPLTLPDFHRYEDYGTLTFVGP